MTTEELQQLKAQLLPELKSALLAESQGVGDGDVRPVTSLSGINSLLAYLRAGSDITIVEAPLSLLQPGIRKSATAIQFRLGEGEWRDVVILEDIRGYKIILRRVDGNLMAKYENEPDTALKVIYTRDELMLKFEHLTPAEVDRLRLHFSDLSAEEVDSLRLHFSDLTEADKNELMRPATEAAEKSDLQTQAAEKATLDATEAADRSNALSDHRDKIVEGYWWRWNEGTDEWYNTGEIARGNVMYATFDVDPSNMELSMLTDEEYTGADFELDDNGYLSVII